MLDKAEEIVRFWFSEKVKPLWFNSTVEFDNELRIRFLDVVNAALNDELVDWLQSPSGCLALVIVLDQFPLNIFRGKTESFCGESKSRQVAHHAIEQGFDHNLSNEQKAFLYMPFMHSENLDDQDLSVKLFEKAGLKENLRFAIHHRDIVRRFGRFPHRNKILDRVSSEEELAYLASDEAFHG